MSVVTRRARQLGPQWRTYFAASWHRIPEWPQRRLESLLNTKEGRAPAKRPGRAAPPPLVVDYPAGKAPFLGVLTLGEDAQRSRDSGVLEFPHHGHLLTVAPTRTGKGTCQIIPNLMLYSGSALVVDIKNENFMITGEHRATMLPGSRVFRFAPLEASSHRYNPFDFIRSGLLGRSTPDTFADVRLVSQMLLPTASRNEEFWDTEARNLLALLLMYVAVAYEADSGKRNMRCLMEHLSGSDEVDDQGRTGMRKTLAAIIAWSRANREMLLLGQAASFLEHEDKVFANIVSTCRSGMEIWKTPHLLTATDKSDFRFVDLKASMCRPVEDSPAPTTLYIVIPPQYLREYRSVVRMMVGLAIAELTRPAEWEAWDDWRPAPPCPVLFLLDELAALGHMPPISDGLAYLAGYNIQLWSFVQNIGQLKHIYQEEWENFTANAGAMSFFGVNDPDTAAYVEKLLGETEEYEHSYETAGMSASETNTDASSTSSSGFSKWEIEESASRSDNQSRSVGVTHSLNLNKRFVREPIARAAEIRALDPDLQFVFIRNTRPALATKLPYYEFPLFAGRHGTW